MLHTFVDFLDVRSAGMDAPPIRYAKTVDGHDIAFTATGEGLPLVLAWGFSELRLRWTSPLFRKLFAHLSKDHLLVQYDPRGQGLSTRGLGTASLDNFVLDLDAIIEHVPTKPVVIMGLMRFAKVALRYAIERQEMTRALVLWNCDPGAPSHGAFGSGRALARSNWDYLVEASARTTFPQDDFEIQRATKVAVMTPADFLVTLDALDQEIAERDLAQLRVPCLVLATRQSSWSFATEEQSRRLARLVPGASLAIFDDVGGGLFSLEDGTPAGLESVLDFVDGPKWAADERGGDPVRGVLSKRESEVLRLLSIGMSNQEIADELGISRNTVRSHVSNILEKVGARNRTQAVAYAKARAVESS